MDTPKHAPTPWKASGKTIKGNTCRDSSKVTIARVDSRGKFVPGCDEANADFIVRACNNHDALLAALKDTVCRLTELRDCTAMLGAAAVDRALIQIGIDQARAAIAQTEKD